MREIERDGVSLRPCLINDRSGRPRASWQLTPTPLSCRCCLAHLDEAPFAFIVSVRVPPPPFFLSRFLSFRFLLTFTAISMRAALAKHLEISFIWNFVLLISHARSFYTHLLHFNTSNHYKFKLQQFFTIPKKYY